MYSRFQAENFYVTTVSADCTLVPWEDWTIPVQPPLPQIEDWKLFYVIFKIDDKDNRFSLPVFLNNWQMCYKWYNVTQIHTLKKYDSVWLNDLAENFNYLFKNIDDIWTIVKKWGLDILVYGWIIVNWGSTLTVNDATLTLEDNTTSHIIFDFSDNEIKAVSELADFWQYYFAEITTSGWEITNIELKKSFNVWEFFSSDVFDRDINWAVILKDGSVKKRDIDFTGVTADDIGEWEEHLLLTPAEREEIWKVQQKQNIIPDLAAIRAWAAAWATAVQPAWLSWYQTKNNMRTTLNAPDNEHYPTTKAVMDKLSEVGAWDMMKDVYDPTRKEADAFNYNNMYNTPNIPSTPSDIGALPASTKYWATFELSLNPTTYVITATLKDQDWNTLWTPATVDLPLESVVVSWSYDSDHEKIVLTLENWQTIDIPVSSLVSWLQAEISVTNKLDADLVDDTNSTNKFVTAAEKNTWNAKWDMNYSDFNFVTWSWATVTLWLSTKIVPAANFTVNAPATVKDWQYYLLRVENWATVYTMTLGTNITNPYNVDATLSANDIDMFVFLWVGSNLELLPQQLWPQDLDHIWNSYYLASNSALATATEIVIDYLANSIAPSIYYQWRMYFASPTHSTTNIWFVNIDDDWSNGWTIYWIEIAWAYDWNSNPVASAITTWNHSLAASVSAATSSTGWTVKLADDTVQSETAQAVSSAANRTYWVQVNSSWQAVVNVPRTDTDTVASWDSWVNYIIKVSNSAPSVWTADNVITIKKL